MSEKLVKTAFLAIGSNLGNKRENIETIKKQLRNNDILIVKSSKNYQTLSWPNKKNPKFINAVLKIKTMLSANMLLKKCLYIEKKIGRIRNKKNEPRLCDIDIIDYNGEIIRNFDCNSLILPHPEMHKRNFVLIPMYEITKSWIHPVKKVSILSLINSLKNDDLRTIKYI
tara:strand:+ start:1073 stop:1582 length:510 start_codon:yes stop_codon:yes gene_type:complete